MLFNLFYLASAAFVVTAGSVGGRSFAELAVRDNTATVTSSVGLSFYNSNFSSGTSGQSNPNSYTCYSGPASNFPAIGSWINFNSMWALQVQYNMGPQGVNDTANEIAWIKSSITSVSQIAKVDARVILAMVILESTGNPNVKCTQSPGGVPNCGLMQSYNPVDQSWNGTQAGILQMIQDGTQGTPNGPGLVQLINDAAGTPQMSGGNVYNAFREYNSGYVNLTNLSNGEGANPAYVSNMANYLLGWNGYGNAPSNCGFVNSPPPTTSSSATTPTYTGTATAAPPAPTVSGTTAQCYQWYTTKSGDTCATIDQTYGISLAYFRSLNTYINANCTNLFADYAYCVNGVAGATAPTTSITTTTTTTSSAVTSAPPTSTVSGTTSSCYQWYTTQSGDTCATIEQDFNITLAYFRSLNTYINSGCTNLFAGYAYCVNGVPVSTSTVITSTATTAASSTQATQPAPSSTVSGTTSSCYQWYTTKSGDTCATIEQDFNITLAYFRSLNTYINSGCTNLFAGYSYCVNGVPVPSSSTATTANTPAANVAAKKTTTTTTTTSKSSSSSSTKKITTTSTTTKKTSTTSSSSSTKNVTTSSTKKTTSTSSTKKPVTT